MEAMTSDVAGGLLTAEQVAKWLGCSVRHVHRLRERGMPCIQAGRSVRYDLERVRYWLQEGGAEQ